MLIQRGPTFWERAVYAAERLDSLVDEIRRGLAEREAELDRRALELAAAQAALAGRQEELAALLAELEREREEVRRLMRQVEAGQAELAERARILQEREAALAEKEQELARREGAQAARAEWLANWERELHEQAARIRDRQPRPRRMTAHLPAAGGAEERPGAVPPGAVVREAPPAGEPVVARVVGPRGEARLVEARVTYADG